MGGVVDLPDDGLQVARVHLLRPVRDRHAHRDARSPRPPALRTRAVPLAARQVPPEVQRPLRFRVDPPVEAFVAYCVCSIESGPCERVESLQMSGRF